MSQSKSKTPPRKKLPAVVPRTRDERLELRLSKKEAEQLKKLVALRKKGSFPGLHTRSQVLRDLIGAAFAASKHGEYRP